MAGASVALGDINVGSDGSDGALDLTGTNGTITIDLSLAADLCDCDGDTQVDDVCTWGCSSTAKCPRD